MTDAEREALWAKWREKFREARAALEARAAAGDPKAIRDLAAIDGRPAPPKPWCETDREPGEEG
jgi:hypothetical protein